ncbi:hypothetical protein [Chondrinema litorale]|uniref:hypothetical protein n=1 Tax=Chondrinema litorale TaxID=2994555 RepID=UPI002543BFE8|nr:hypothetical protein [Chondrinema litorale]UZR92876.1 hypothetical protein OQ292_13525 [Chondrinema litorale]
MLLHKRLLALLVLLSFIIFSCDDEGDETQVLTEEESESKATFEDIMYVNAEINSAMGMSVSAMGTMGGRIAEDDYFCGTMTYSLEENFEFIYDFGEGCEGVDGKLRKGKIIMSFDGFDSESITYSITYDGFYVDGNEIRGTVTTSAYVLNENENYAFNITMSGFEVSFSDGESFTYNASYSYEWVEGFASMDPYTSVFNITGTSSGTTRDGLSYSTEITSPYVLKTSCYYEGYFYPVSGVIDVSPVGKSEYSVDFGSGSCDKTVSITLGAKSFDVELP